MLAGKATRIDAMSNPRPFTRSRHDRMIAGVMGGIAQRFGWNSTLLRAIFVIFSIASAAFPGILVYLILWLLMPEEGA
jgi:phage shock protein PspC (stress-responsive transcriptional regulator)